MYACRCWVRTSWRCTGSGTKSARRTGRAMAERGETMPVAIALGGDPASRLRGVGAAAADDRRVPVRGIPAR